MNEALNVKKVEQSFYDDRLNLLEHRVWWEFNEQVFWNEHELTSAMEKVISQRRKK